jgi:hypothetical protein
MFRQYQSTLSSETYHQVGWAKQQLERGFGTNYTSIIPSTMTASNTNGDGNKVRRIIAASETLSSWHMASLQETASERRRVLRNACAQAIYTSKSNSIMRRCEVRVNGSHNDAMSALANGIAFENILPESSRDESCAKAAITDMYEDMLACVLLWANVTGRSRASVLVTLTRKKTSSTKLHLDHVDARVLCTLFGKGTQWVTSPDWLHAFASFADHDRGNAIADALKEAVHNKSTNKGALLTQAQERQVVLVRGTAHPGLMRGTARLHSSPDVDPAMKEWRLFFKVDDGPGWGRKEHLQHLKKPSVSRLRRTWGQHLMERFRLFMRPATSKKPPRLTKRDKQLLRLRNGRPKLLPKEDRSLH